MKTKKRDQEDDILGAMVADAVDAVDSSGDFHLQDDLFFIKLEEGV